MRRLFFAAMVSLGTLILAASVVAAGPIGPTP